MILISIIQPRPEPPLLLQPKRRCDEKSCTIRPQVTGPFSSVQYLSAAGPEPKRSLTAVSARAQVQSAAEPMTSKLLLSPKCSPTQITRYEEPWWKPRQPRVDGAHPRLLLLLLQNGVFVNSESQISSNFVSNLGSTTLTHFPLFFCPAQNFRVRQIHFSIVLINQSAQFVSGHGKMWPVCFCLCAFTSGSKIQVQDREAVKFLCKDFYSSITKPKHYFRVNFLLPF